MTTKIIYSFDSNEDIPTILLEQHHDGYILHIGSKHAPIDSNSKIVCQYLLSGWGPIVDYSIEVSLISGHPDAIEMCYLHSPDDDLDNSWKHIQHPLQKIAEHMDCPIFFRDLST